MNTTRVVLSIPAILVASLHIGVSLNWALGGTRTVGQRIAMALCSVIAAFLTNTLFAIAMKR